MTIRVGSQVETELPFQIHNGILTSNLSSEALDIFFFINYHLKCHKKLQETSRVNSFLNRLEIVYNYVYTVTQHLVPANVPEATASTCVLSVLQVFTVTATPWPHVLMSFSHTRGKPALHVSFIVHDSVLYTCTYAHGHKMYKDVHTHTWAAFISRCFILLALLFYCFYFEFHYSYLVGSDSQNEVNLNNRRLSSRT